MMKYTHISPTLLELTEEMLSGVKKRRYSDTDLVEKIQPRQSSDENILVPEEKNILPTC